MTPYPEWLYILSWAYLSGSFVCALMIVIDELRRPQKLMIMNFVWPITALYLGPAALWGYFRSGLKMTRQHHQQMQREIQAELQAEGGNRPAISSKSVQVAPTREQVAVATTHCGAGCTLGDIIAEWWVFAMALTFAGGEFQTRLVMDFILAWIFGIVFQYMTIVPIRRLSFGKGLFQAIRADTLVIILFEIGLFAWMTFTHYVLFPGPHLKPTETVFWFMMQVGMIIGFFASYPVNSFLLKIGWKEKMPQDEYEMERKMREEQVRSSRAA
jgi:uncharacterized protein DUF4396